jgi:hypothetical protein
VENLATPDELAQQAATALAKASGTRAVVLLGADARASRDEYVAALRRALEAIREGCPAGITIRRIKGLERSVVKVAARAQAVWLQDRDRDALGLVGLARYLSAAQLQALAFPGIHRTIALRRLRQLATTRTGALLRVEHFTGATRERIRVWSLTHVGYAEAEKAAALPKNYSTDPLRPEVLQHLVWLNELFVGLATAGGAPVHPRSLPFRWLCDTDHPLSFRTRGPDGSPATGYVAPDAVVEFPSSRVRVFVEAERGTHTIVPVSPSKTGATVAKFDRYTAYFSDITDLRTHATAYRDAFGDDLEPELLFLVHAETRRDRVREAIAERRARDPNPPAFRVEVLTMEDATRRYVGLLHAAPPASPPEPQAPPRRAPSLALEDADVAMMKAAFNALLRRAKDAQAAGVGGLTSAERDVIAGARALLAKAS